MIHEWWGFNESITKTAEIFSNKNIRVFVPDLYRNEAANSAEVSLYL
jgi:dienelactone hydrolase